MKPEDMPRVEEMMRALWPGAKPPYDFDKETVFVWEESGALDGFISVSIRPYVNGSESEPCPHVEGWYVEPALRGKGIGRALMERVEGWARGKGFAELTSDVEIQNQLSMDIHKAMGFTPTTRVQYFKKKL